MIKVLWGSDWDPLLAQDDAGLLRQLMEECVDGEYQRFKGLGGATIRKEFFGKYPELLPMVEHLSDEELGRLKRGGHDPQKVYNAYHRAMQSNGKPTVILAKTVKGYGLGEAGEGKNITHQQKKLNETELEYFRKRFDIPVSDTSVKEISFYRPPEDSEEMRYLRERTEAMGGPNPVRKPPKIEIGAPELRSFKDSLEGSRGRDVSTTMAFVAVLKNLISNKELGKYVVADHSGRGAHLRHGVAVPHARHLRQPGPALQTRRLRDAPLLQGGERRPDPRGGHHRSRVDGVVHGGGDGVRQLRRADDAVLHLLLDVRLPADRRSDLGVR